MAGEARAVGWTAKAHFRSEGPTVAKRHHVIAERDQLRGQHHEIHLSDIRKAAPEKWQAIVRQPLT